MSDGFTCLARGCNTVRDNDWFLCERHKKLLPQTFYDTVRRLQLHPHTAGPRGARNEISCLVFNHFWDNPQ